MEGTAELLNLVRGEACLELLQALAKFSLGESAWLALGLLVSPLVEEAFVG